MEYVEKVQYLGNYIFQKTVRWRWTYKPRSEKLHEISKDSNTINRNAKLYLHTARVLPTTIYMNI